MAFLVDKCTFSELTEQILIGSEPFSCGNDDLDDFFRNDATRYAHYLMGKTYCFRLQDDSSQIVCAFTVSNDSIRIYDLPRSRRDYMKSLTNHEKPLRRYPGVLIGRLGVNSNFAGKGIGSETLEFIKGWFFSRDNKTGCRFVIVDAVNEPQVISFYEKKWFSPIVFHRRARIQLYWRKKGFTSKTEYPAIILRFAANEATLKELIITAYSNPVLISLSPQTISQ